MLPKARDLVAMDDPESPTSLVPGLLIWSPKSSWMKRGKQENEVICSAHSGSSLMGFHYPITGLMLQLPSLAADCWQGSLTAVYEN